MKILVRWGAQSGSAYFFSICGIAAYFFLFCAVPVCWAIDDKLMQQVSGSVFAPSSKFFDGKKSVSLDAFKGKYVLVNFWATWCAPCVKEMPALDRLASRLEKQGLIVVAISQDEGGVAQVKPFLDKMKLTKTKILYALNKRVFRDYALRGLPTSILISPEGKLIARLEGAATWDEGILVTQIERLIN